MNELKKAINWIQVKFIAMFSNTAILFVITALIFGSIFILSTPSLWGVDGATQFARAYQISEGHILSEKVPISKGGGYGGKIPANIVELWGLVQNNLEHLPSNEFSNHQFINQSSQFLVEHQKLSTKQEYFNFSNTAAYSPIVYIPSVIGIEIAHTINANIQWTILLGRMADLLFYILCVYLAIKALISTKAKWIIFSVALIPMALYQASIINADATTNAIAILFAALFIKTVFLKKQLTKLETILLFISIATIPIIKPTYIFIAFLVLIIPNKMLRGKKAGIYKFCALIIGILAFIMWTYLTRGAANDIRLLRSGANLVDVHKQASYIIGNSLLSLLVLPRTLLLNDNAYMLSFFGTLGFSFIQIPAIAIISSISALVISILIAEEWIISKLNIIFTLLVLAACVVAVFVTLYLTFTPVGYPTIQGVQGRYFIPLAALMLVCVSIFRLRLKQDNSTNKLSALAIPTLVVISLASSALEFIYVLHG